jgi:hypothetical protein
MSPRDRGQSRLAWIDRPIVPSGIVLAPSRWRQHVVQRRISRLDHVRPHRLNWEALRHPEQAAGEDDEALTPRRVAGTRWSRLDGFCQTGGFASAVVGPLLEGWLADTFGFHVIFGGSGAGRLLGVLLHVWLAVWPILGTRGSRPATSAAGAA